MLSKFFAGWTSWASCWKSEPVYRFGPVGVDRFHKKMMGTDSDFSASDYDCIQSEDNKHVWHFEPILERILFSNVLLQ